MIYLCFNLSAYYYTLCCSENLPCITPKDVCIFWSSGKFLLRKLCLLILHNLLCSSLLFDHDHGIILINSFLYLYKLN